MTQRNRECKVQVQAPARVCTYSSTDSPCTCACTHPAPGHSPRPRGAADTPDRRRPATRRTACSAPKRNTRWFQPTPVVARRRRNPRHSRANRPRQMERMGIAGLQNRKAPTMERARRIRMDRTSVCIIYRSARALTCQARADLRCKFQLSSHRYGPFLLRIHQSIEPTG